jgi:hypothetical protein
MENGSIQMGGSGCSAREGQDQIVAEAAESH